MNLETWRASKGSSQRQPFDTDRWRERWRWANHIWTEFTWCRCWTIPLKKWFLIFSDWFHVVTEWTLWKHHLELVTWQVKWPKRFSSNRTTVFLVQRRLWVLNCLHSRESKPNSGLPTGFWLAQRQWHELCALTALEMNRSRILYTDMM